MNNTIAIHTHKVKFKTAPELYGLFFEDINHAADGGLYPEMIRNRAFEDSLLPEGCTTDPDRKIFVTEYGWPGAFNHGEGMDEWCAAVEDTEVPGWYTENAKITLLEEETLNSFRKAALRVDFKQGGKLFNIGYCGVPVEKGRAVHFYFFAKCSGQMNLRVSLENASGESLGCSCLSLGRSGEYVRCDCEIVPEGTDFNGQLCLSSDKEASLLLGFTSLMPKDTYKGHGLRSDLCEMLKNTHARFIRFPGGCVVEGINEQNALRFSRTIGPVWERPGCQLMWHYRTTNGLGFHEYLQLCEDLEMEAMYVCNCGMSCQARHGGGFSEEMTKEYLQEALNALEYALGSEDTPYGSLRAKYGRKEPFRLKYVEIGNENWGPEYSERYRLFYDTLKKAWPQVIYISNAHTEREGLPTEMADEHYYDAPEFFLENGDHFDDYDRSGPGIFLGEYAVNGGNTIASMECALAESVFLLGAENNQDIVRLTAYAPLFQNSDYTAWKPNMIVFNNHEVYGIPSYHAVSLLGKHRGEEVIELENQTEEKPPVYFGIPGIRCDKGGLRFKNPMVNKKPVDISRCIYGEVQKDGDESILAQGTDRHHYTGKSRQWNEAFERFISTGPFHEEPTPWCVFSEEELTEYCFEIDVLFTEDNPVTLSVWNHHPETDAGCNEPKDPDWTSRSVRSQVWRIANGTSALRVPHFFDAPLSPEEMMPVKLEYGAYSHLEMVCDRFGYRCYINGHLVQEKKLPLHPVISAAASQDEQFVYLKLANVEKEAQQLCITLDCDISQEVLAETLSAEPDAVNSFERKEAVAPVRSKLSGGREFTFRVPGYSLNVLKMKKL